MNRPDISVAATFLRIEQEDANAFKDLFTLYYDRLFTTAVQYCKTEAIAEDIVQEIFLYVWEKRHRLNDIRDPEAWMFTVARNKAKNALQEQFASDRYRTFVKQVFSQEESSPEHLLITRQRKELIDKSLTGLSQKQKEVYKLSRENGLTYEEIAKKLGITRDTVKEHITRAVAKIKKFLTEHRDEFIVTIFFIINN